MISLTRIPASFFGIVIGMVGLGGNWRSATALWGMPAFIGETIMAVATLIWAVLLIGYALKWWLARAEALAEVHHAIQCCFIGLLPSSTTLIALAVAPYAHRLAVVIWLIGAISQLIFGVVRFGGMWRGNRELDAVTPVMLLPTVAGNLISAIVGGALGFDSWSILFFGAGMANWLVMESAILHRLWTQPPLTEPLRPALGIQLGPPAVVVTAYLANTHDVPNLLVQAVWGYSLFQLLILLRLLPWITRQPFTQAYWAFSFGMTALAGGALEMSQRGVSGAIPTLAAPVFILTNLTLLTLAVDTVWRLLQGRLLPPPMMAPSESS